MANRMFWALAGFCTLLLAAAPATQPGNAELEKCWADLAGPEPMASAALLRLNDTPDATIAFLKTHMRALRATPEELEGRLADLGSNDPAVWKPAFDALCYFDPRLTMSLPDLMDIADDATTRNRLVAALCDMPADQYKGTTIKLEPLKPDDGYNFRSEEGSWWAESKVARINAGRWGTIKSQWTRAIRAITLLRHFNTPSSLAIVSDMATGHPDALPTRVAKGEISQ